MRLSTAILVALLLLAAGTYLIVQSTSDLSHRLRTQPSYTLPEGEGR